MRKLSLMFPTILSNFGNGTAKESSCAPTYGQADAMTEEERLQDSEQYDFYVSAEVCSLGSVVIGLVIAAIGALGVFSGRRHAAVVKEGA